MGDPGLTLHTSNRLEVLVAGLHRQLADRPLPPLRQETIVVPGQGLARWLQLELAARLGVAASLDLVFPGAFLQRIAGGARGAAAAGDAFDRGTLTWRIFRLLGDPKATPRLGPAARYCERDPDQRRRLQLARRLAACLSEYQLWRDDVLWQWQTQAPKARGPAWQAWLWRQLVAETTPPDDDRPAFGLPFERLPVDAAKAATPVTAHTLEQVRRRLADPDARAHLPARLHVFGTPELPPAVLDLLPRIARWIPVTAWIPQPTPHFFGDHRATATDDAGNPLLARLGRPAREFADRLQQAPFDSALRPLDFVDAGTDSVLHTLQSDLANVRHRASTGDAPPLPIAPGDRSLQLHSCHSPLREIEVLRDQLLDAFARDPGLRPADVLVLVPDIERYAPLVHAVFGPVADRLPFHVADRNPAAALPEIAALLAVLDLTQERLAAFDVLHLLTEPAIARRFGITAADLPTLRAWTVRAGIRWGIDGEWRQQRWQLPAIDAYGWEQGLRRLLLGTITGPTEGLVAGIAPVGDATDGRVDLLARFVQFVRTLFGELRHWQRPQPLDRHADGLDRLFDTLFATDGQAEAAAAIVRATTAELRAEAATAALTEPVSTAVLRQWLHDRLQRLGQARGFLTGSITVAMLEPMRTIPMRVVAVAGLDDQSFPRRRQPLTFDLIAQERRPGDRDVRADDRQLFLDTLLAARERLLLTWVGRSAKDDSECAPSCVIADLCDCLRRAFVPPPLAGGPGDRRADAVDWLLVQHPLQAFSPRYLDRADPRLFTFAGAESPRPDAPAATAPFAPADVACGRQPPPTSIALDALLRFWVNPCRFWLQHGLGVRLHDRDDDPDDVEPFAIDPLMRWGLQDEQVRQRLQGTLPADPVALAHARGRLPPGQVGRMGMVDAAHEAAVFVARVQRLGPTTSRAIAIAGPGWTLTGELGGFTQERLVLQRMAKFKTKDHLRLWIQHLVQCAAALAAGERPLPTVFLARDKTFVANPVADPIPHLTVLIDGFREGHARPLPFFELSSHQFAERGAQAARAEWLPGEPLDEWTPSSDSTDPWIALAMRDRDPLTEPGFATWATAVWGPALAWTHEDAIR